MTTPGPNVGSDELADQILATFNVQNAPALEPNEAPHLVGEELKRDMLKLFARLHVAGFKPEQIVPAIQNVSLKDGVNVHNAVDGIFQQVTETLLRPVLTELGQQVEDALVKAVNIMKDDYLTGLERDLTIILKLAEGSLDTKERLAIIKHAKERSSDQTAFIGALCEAVDIVAAGGIDALRTFEKDTLGWEVSDVDEDDEDDSGDWKEMQEGEEEEEGDEDPDEFYDDDPDDDSDYYDL
jgi:hypothetical protein